LFASADCGSNFGSSLIRRRHIPLIESFHAACNRRQRDHESEWAMSNLYLMMRQTHIKH